MAAESYIIRQIEEIVEGKYRKWQIGVTDKPITHKAELGNPLTWLHWKSDSQQEAKNVERYFLDKGLKSETITSRGLYVYIFNPSG